MKKYNTLEEPSTERPYFYLLHTLYAEQKVSPVLHALALFKRIEGFNFVQIIKSTIFGETRMT